MYEIGCTRGCIKGSYQGSAVDRVRYIASAHIERIDIVEQYVTANVVAVDREG